MKEMLMKHKPNPNNGNPNTGHLDTCADPETDPSRFQEFWKHKTARSIIITQGKYIASWGRVLWNRHKVCARGCDCFISGKVKQRAAYFPG